MDRLSTQEKIKLGTLTRLGMIAPYVDRWPEALAVMGQPKNVPMSLNHLAKIVDEIWHLAGDKSADVRCATAPHTQVHVDFSRSVDIGNET